MDFYLFQEKYKQLLALIVMGPKVLNVDKEKLRSLFFAACSNHCETVVQRLLETGVDPNTKNKWVSLHHHPLFFFFHSIYF